jgi:hypothetical protein
MFARPRTARCWRRARDAPISNFGSRRSSQRFTRDVNDAAVDRGQPPLRAKKTACLALRLRGNSVHVSVDVYLTSRLCSLFRFHAAHSNSAELENRRPGLHRRMPEQCAAVDAGAQRLQRRTAPVHVAAHCGEGSPLPSPGSSTYIESS